MRRDEIVVALRASPFRPFRLHLSDGGVLDVRHPEMLMLTRHSAIVGLQENGGVQQADEGYPEIERHAVVDLLHVTRIEQVAQAGRRPT